jgi:hypothetical protein
MSERPRFPGALGIGLLVPSFRCQSLAGEGRPRHRWLNQTISTLTLFCPPLDRQTIRRSNESTIDPSLWD